MCERERRKGDEETEKVCVRERGEREMKRQRKGERERERELQYIFYNTYF